MTRLEALEKVAEAAREAKEMLSPYITLRNLSEQHGKIIMNIYYDLDKALEELDKVPKTQGDDVDQAWERYKDNHPPKGQAALYYTDNAEYWKAGFRTARASQGSSVTAEHKDPTVLVQALKVYGSIYNWRVASQKNSERAGFEFMADDQAGYLAREALRQWESQK